MVPSGHTRYGCLPTRGYGGGLYRAKFEPSYSTSSTAGGICSFLRPLAKSTSTFVPDAVRVVETMTPTPKVFELTVLPGAYRSREFEA